MGRPKYKEFLMTGERLGLKRKLVGLFIGFLLFVLEVDLNLKVC